MAFFISLLFLSSWTALALTFPHNTIGNILKRSRGDFESSGDGADQPVQGVVKVVQLDRRALAQSGLFAKGLIPRRSPSLGSRSPFPAFLSRGRPGPSTASRTAVSPLRHLRPKGAADLEVKKKQGLQMWQRAMDKGGKTSLPISLKDTKQTCTAVPFTQHVTADGCETVTVHNKLCFGQCSSLFIPTQAESNGTGAHHGQRRGPCSRCAPSKAHTVTVALRCQGPAQERRVMVVEECKCETGMEERSAEAAAST